MRALFGRSEGDVSVRRGLAIGCGGALGFAWTAHALAALEEALDWDVRTAEVLIGTSAGSEIVAALGSGRTPADLVAALEGRPGSDSVLTDHLARHPGHVPPPPTLKFAGAGLLKAGLRHGQAYTVLAGLLPVGRGDAAMMCDFGQALVSGTWVNHPKTWIVAIDARTGERVAFGADGAPTASLGEAIAASWAIPGWFPPVRIGDRWFLDGGSVSSVSADLLLPLGLDEVVVVAPMTSEGGAPGRGVARIERVLRRQMTRGLDAEVASLASAGTRVIRIEPGLEDLAAMGANFMNIRAREATLRTARRTCPARVHSALAEAGLNTNNEGARR